MNCETCGKEYTPECDYRQGRCPHHPPMLNIQPRDTSKGHFFASMVKSAFRIAAGVSLIWPESLWLAGGYLIAAEVMGIIEELV
jgi:hypothetical protein